MQLNGRRESGEAEIYPEGHEGEPVLVYCDMETDGGGWTVRLEQRRTTQLPYGFVLFISDQRAGFRSIRCVSFQVFQRRVDGKTDFYRGWKDYSKGFGFLSDEFWLGTVYRQQE